MPFEQQNWPLLQSCSDFCRRNIRGVLLSWNHVRRGEENDTGFRLTFFIHYGRTPNKSVSIGYFNATPIFTSKNYYFSCIDALSATDKRLPPLLDDNGKWHIQFTHPIYHDCIVQNTDWWSFVHRKSSEETTEIHRFKFKAVVTIPITIHARSSHKQPHCPNQNCNILIKYL